MSGSEAVGGSGDVGARHHPLGNLRIGTALSDDRYELVDPDGNVEPAGGSLTAVASGDAGQVFRATTELGLSYAIKILNPSRDLVEGGSGAFHETFDREIRLLARITHTRLAKITDIGHVPDEEGTRVPFYVMDYIHGTPFQKYVESSTPSAREFLRLVDQILEGVEYLHARWIMHCDLKSANILVGVDEAIGHGPAQATIVDLGVAKVVKDSTEDGDDDTEDPADTGDPLADFKLKVGDNEKTYFVSSRPITRDEWKPFLMKNIPRRALRHTLFPDHDLYGIGILISDALAVESLDRKLRDEIGESGLEALRELAGRLIEDAGSDRYYHSVEQVRRDWGKLDPGYLAPVGIPGWRSGLRRKPRLRRPAGASV